MNGRLLRRAAIAFTTWLPFFAIWTLVSLSFGTMPATSVLVASLITMGSAGLLGVAVWFACERRPWPFGFDLRFYLVQIVFGVLYGIAWTASVAALELLRDPRTAAMWTRAAVTRQVVMGVWFYAVFAGISYAVQTRNRLHEKETLAARAEALAAAARLDAVRARLNPHFLFNALHTLAALVKFKPALADSAIERLGDMLRYTLREDTRGIVEFAEEYAFTQQYLAFEQLRYEDRLRVDLEIDPDALRFDIPPFSIQTLAENAVRHAIATRPEGGTIRIACTCVDGHLEVSVRDDGAGSAAEGSDSHRLGLRSLRERLIAAFGPAADLRIHSNGNGFEATFVVPTPRDEAPIRTGLPA